jgi:hypothetical protein
VEAAGQDDQLIWLRRTVFYGQWFVALLAPIVLFVGRSSWLGAPAGWLSGFGLVMLAPPFFLALGLPVLVVAGDQRAMRDRIVRRPYALATATLWAALVAFVVSVSDPDDPASSLLVIWTRGSVSAEVAGQVAMLAGGLMFGAWLVALGFAVGGLLEARRRRPD